jgi:hypothetical protein
MTGDSTLIYGRPAKGMVNGWLTIFRPVLYVRCQAKEGVDVYVHTGMATQPEYAGGHSVRVKVDADAPQAASWTESTNNDALFWRPTYGESVDKFLQRLRGAKQLLFEFTPFRASAAMVEFELTGLDGVADRIWESCPREPKHLGLNPSAVRTNVAADVTESVLDGPVMAAPGSASPRYPDILKSAGVKGEVLAQFVVDTTGRAVLSSYKVLEASHDLFASAVKNALPNMRFIPARVGGKRVEQVVEWPFVFGVPK